jgi:hypothetical protein
MQADHKADLLEEKKDEVYLRLTLALALRLLFAALFATVCFGISFPLV